MIVAGAEHHVPNSKCNDLPGVIGGETERLQSTFAKLSAYMSASRPSFTTSYGWKPKYGPLIGVGRVMELAGGLLMVLPDVDKGGVDGAYEDPRW